MKLVILRKSHQQYLKSDKRHIVKKNTRVQSNWEVSWGHSKFKKKIDSLDQHLALPRSFLPHLMIYIYRMQKSIYIYRIKAFWLD